MNNKEDALLPDTQDNVPSPPPPQPCKKKSSCTVWCSLRCLLLVVGVVALGLFAGFLYKMQMQQAKVIGQLRHQQRTQQSEQLAKAQASEQLQEALHSKLLAVTHHVQALSNQNLMQNREWLLIKVRYYLELAQINTYWSTNYSASIALLEAASALMKQINLPDSLALRQAIAFDMAELKTKPALDIAGLLSQLDAAQRSVSQMTLHHPLQDQATGVAPASQKSWRTQLQHSVDLLGKLVVIRRDDDAAKPLLSPFYQAIIKESIRLNLQEAQWAVLNNNPTVYALVLEQAIRLVDATKNNAALLAQLRTLSQAKIAQEKPALGKSLQLLEKLESNAMPAVNKQGAH